jgi:putative oxidoreductase
MKKRLFKTTIEQSNLNEFTLTTLRIITGLLMLGLHGLGKIPPSEKFLEGVTNLGFPMAGFFAWAAGLSEFIGGVLLVIGLLTRPAALFIAITMLVAAFGKHIEDPIKVKELALLYFAIAIIFASRGAGRWSLDYFINRKL